MPSHDGKYARELLRKLNSPAAALQVGANADNPRNPSARCSLNNLLQLARKIRIIQVRVGVVIDFGHKPRSFWTRRVLLEPGNVRIPGRWVRAGRLEEL